MLGVRGRADSAPVLRRLMSEEAVVYSMPWGRAKSILGGLATYVGCVAVLVALEVLGHSTLASE